ncbi:GTP 3',8-cyclase MoaA [Longimicrobium sp.]|uniref:GTP 3',8-cyclase MoaA n=1 Tax=Longimicrobium sp. TaxID=2029185 RepID=UPI002E352539|nr:GTP 3',8-cyclase MoaA [Longimicrobium sp.]HEX6041083.1 GTP 3',8-cyclase MoaA [Longimicrobium sp.]
MTPLVQLGPLAVAPSRPVPQSGPMADGFGRRIEYLRISVTDKCNLRCVYCMPEEGLPWMKREQILRYEEIAEVVRVMADLGLRRIRLTGGEPLVRRDLSSLVRMIRAVPGIDDVALSTNAVLLADQADALRDAGVDRVNVSLDSLRPERIDAISRRPGSAEAIFRGLKAAERAGFGPIKVNCVVMRGRNDDEVADFAAVTRERPWHVRFIEVMPTGDNLGVQADEFVSADEMLERVGQTGDLRPVAGPGGNGPARYFAFPGAAGTVGVITPMSHNYCERCNRMRLTADGQLRPCLFGHLQTNLRDPLRRGEPLEPLIRHTLAVKPERHWLEHGTAAGSGGLRALSEVGG